MRGDPPVAELTTMKRLLVLTAMLTAMTSAVGCNCMRGRGAPCAPVCMPAAQCAPTVNYGDCGPTTTTYGEGTVVEPYMGTPTPAGTTVVPGPASFTPGI